MRELKLCMCPPHASVTIKTCEDCGGFYTMTRHQPEVSELSAIIREMSVEPEEQCDKIAEEIMRYLTYRRTGGRGR